MDIGLLSKMIAELMEDHDSVSLPGLGAFVAAVVPASFSDRGFSINPPYRKLSFVSGCSDDCLLANLYARENAVDADKAKAILSHYFDELKTALETRKSISLPSLGRLRTTKDNNIFFVPDQDLDIYPDGFGLEVVSLRNTAAVDDGSFDAGVAPFTEPLPFPKAEELLSAPEKSGIEAGDIQQPDARESAVEQVNTPEEHRGRWWLWPVAIIFAAAFALALFLVLSHVAPDFIDSILYTQEELQIINY